MQLERLASVAGIDIDDDQQILIKIEKGLHPGLIDRIYQSDKLPDEYQLYKQKAIDIDELWSRRRDMKKGDPTGWTTPTNRRTESGVRRNVQGDAMEVDRTKERKRGPLTCYACGGQGHIARNCTKKTENREVRVITKDRETSAVENKDSQEATTPDLDFYDGGH
jgi:hypothetical protein